MTKVVPVEAVTGRAAAYPVVLEELLPAAWHRTEPYANNWIEADLVASRRGCDRCEDSSRTALPG